MELRHLRYFIAVAEELHFGRAAERLHMAQPPLSQQIMALEEEIGTPLFLRTKRHVELTAAGDSFLTEARKILAQTDHAIHTARRAGRGESGRLIVGFVNSAVFGESLAIFRLMHRRYPDISLVLQDLTSEEQVEAMKAHQIDVGLIRPPVPDAESLSIRVAWREPVWIALPHGHRLAKQKIIPMRELANESFLMIPRHLAPGFYDQLIGLCARSGFTPKVGQEAHSMQIIVSLISAGLGISLVPASMENFQRKGVVYRPIKPATTTDLAVMWRPDDPSPALRSFLEVVWSTHVALDPTALRHQ
jgi:DNA-binding transcriptional LysR family regulator